MIKVTFLPDNKTIGLMPGENLLNAAFDNGVDIPSMCQLGTCYTCTAFVEKGEEFLVEDYFGDEITAEFKPASKSILTCITQVRTDITEAEIIISVNI